MKPIRFVLFAGIGAVILGGLSCLALDFLNKSELVLPALSILLWVLILTSGSYAWIFPSLSGTGPAFMNRVLGVTMLRLLLGIGIVFLLLFLFPNGILPLVILFFFYYSAGLAFEIFQLLRNLRDISK